MILKPTRRFLKSYIRLPEKIKAKVRKTLFFLQTNPRYPSLYTKKVLGKIDLWEARADNFYRLTYTKVDDTAYIEDVGPHDEGLGKK